MIGRRMLPRTPLPLCRCVRSQMQRRGYNTSTTSLTSSFSTSGGAGGSITRGATKSSTSTSCSTTSSSFSISLPTSCTSGGATGGTFSKQAVRMFQKKAPLLSLLDRYRRGNQSHRFAGPGGEPVFFAQRYRARNTELDEGAIRNRTVFVTVAKQGHGINRAEPETDAGHVGASSTPAGVDLFFDSTSSCSSSAPPPSAPHLTGTEQPPTLPQNYTVGGSSSSTAPYRSARFEMERQIDPRSMSSLCPAVASSSVAQGLTASGVYPSEWTRAASYSRRSMMKRTTSSLATRYSSSTLHLLAGCNHSGTRSSCSPASNIDMFQRHLHTSLSPIRRAPEASSDGSIKARSGSAASASLESTAEDISTELRKNSEINLLIPRKVAAPTWNQLHIYAAHCAVPMVGFGMMDNFIMIQAGDIIDCSIGAVFGFSTITAAAMGQICSDTSGVCFGGFVDAFFNSLGLPKADLTPDQIALDSVRFVRTVAMAIGVFSGCLIGMTSLLFMDLDKKERLKRQKALATIFSTLAEEGSDLCNVERCTLYIVEDDQQHAWSAARRIRLTINAKRIKKECVKEINKAAIGDIVSTQVLVDCLRKLGWNEADIMERVSVTEKPVLSIEEALKMMDDLSDTGEEEERVSLLEGGTKHWAVVNKRVLNVADVASDTRFTHSVLRSAALLGVGEKHKVEQQSTAQSAEKVDDAKLVKATSNPLPLPSSTRNVPSGNASANPHVIGGGLEVISPHDEKSANSTTSSTPSNKGEDQQRVKPGEKTAAAPAPDHKIFTLLLGPVFEEVDELVPGTTPASERKVIGLVEMVNKKDENGNVVPFSADDEKLVQMLCGHCSSFIRQAQED
ncbi:unnamed protein product [Amoebophrya sp. A25]|nr:unnamed protein product [Amoebophrya sp. A25]|eukprot:GSA25T00013869001.1